MSKSAKTLTLAEMEKQLILTSLKRNGYNRNATARELDVSPATIRNKLKAYGIAIMHEVVVPMTEHEESLEKYEPPKAKRLRG